MRVRWIVLPVMVLLVVAAFYWSSMVTGVTIEQRDGRRTWIIEAGEEVTLSDENVRPGDRFRCEGIDVLIERTPGRGHRVAREGSTSGVIQVETAEVGDVTVSCDPDAVFP